MQSKNRLLHSVCVWTVVSVFHIVAVQEHKGNGPALQLVVLPTLVPLLSDPAGAGCSSNGVVGSPLL